MQRFKKHFSTSEGRFSGGHPHMNGYGKFVYGANGTLCQYARWRNEQISQLNDAALNRYMRSSEGHRAYLLDAHFCLGQAGACRVLATLPLTLCDGRAGMFDAC